MLCLERLVVYFSTHKLDIFMNGYQYSSWFIESRSGSVFSIDIKVSKFLILSVGASQVSITIAMSVLWS